MEPGIFKRVRSGAIRAGAAAAFIDRDGVVIEDSGYLSEPGKIRVIRGSLEAISQLNAAGVAVVVVTNQSGVGRGYYTWADFEQVQEEIERELAVAGGWIDGTWACAYHSEAVGPYRVEDHPFRKPNPGMILDAAEKMGLAIEKSWVIGDRLSDVEAGLRAGVLGTVWVRGSGESILRHEQLPARFAGLKTELCANLEGAVERILHGTASVAGRHSFGSVKADAAKQEQPW